MTPEDWKNVEDALSSPYGRVEFKNVSFSLKEKAAFIKLSNTLLKLTDNALIAYIVEVFAKKAVDCRIVEKRGIKLCKLIFGFFITICIFLFVKLGFSKISTKFIFLSPFSKFFNCFNIDRWKKRIILFSWERDRK